jgi:transposase
VRILLKADRSQPGARWTDQQIASALEVSRATVLRVRQRFVPEGWTGQPVQAVAKAVRRRTVAGHRPRKLDGAQEAHPIAIACSATPEGYDHWGLRLFADRLVQLEIVEHSSPESVRQVLQTTHSSRG